MPRGAGRGFRGGGQSPRPGYRGSPPTARAPPPRRDFHQTTPRPQQKPGGSGSFFNSGKGAGVGGVIAGSFLGSALGSVLGNAISSKMYQGRNPETGVYEDAGRPDTNPCRRELDYFLQCAKFSPDQNYCKGASDSLKKCADKHKDYFEENEE